MDTGLSGRKDLARRCILYRVPVAWWLCALFLAPGVRVPHLLNKYSPLLASVIVGVIWAAWHPDVFLAPVRRAAMFTAGAVALSVVMTVMFLHTRGSVLLATARHASVMPGKEVARISFPGRAEPPDWLRAVVVIALAAIVVLLTGKRLRLRKDA